MSPAISRRRALAMSVAFLGLAGAAWAEADSLDPAPALIQTFYDALLAGLKQAKDLGVQGRFEKLAPVVERIFDLPTMTRVACGPSWAKLPADKQAALVAAFRRMTIANYASQFTEYAGQQFVVDPKASPHHADLIVHSKLIPAHGAPVTINYRMRGSGIDWKVVDVYLDGTISQLAVRRSEFTAILHSAGPDKLLATLQDQNDRLLKGN
jgi:phospholipid transport system substrate-binding protein